MDGSEDTYAEHIYGYDEMDKYAYVLEEARRRMSSMAKKYSHPGRAASSIEKEMPVCAPAVATNAYATVEYTYNLEKWRWNGHPCRKTDYV